MLVVVDASGYSGLRCTVDVLIYTYEQRPTSKGTPGFHAAQKTPRLLPGLS